MHLAIICCGRGSTDLHSDLHSAGKPLSRASHLEAPARPSRPPRLARRPRPETAAACAEENQPSLSSTDTPDDHTSSTGLSKLAASASPCTPHHTRTAPAPHPHHTRTAPHPHRQPLVGLEGRGKKFESRVLSARAEAIPPADEILRGHPAHPPRLAPHPSRPPRLLTSALAPLPCTAPCPAPCTTRTGGQGRAGCGLAPRLEMRNTTWSVFSRLPMNSSLTTSDPTAREALITHACMHAHSQLAISDSVVQTDPVALHHLLQAYGHSSPQHFATLRDAPPREEVRYGTVHLAALPTHTPSHTLTLTNTHAHTHTAHRTPHALPLARTRTRARR